MNAEPMIRLLRTLVVVASAVTALAGSRPQTRDPAPLFFDDFSGRELDRSKWNVIVTGRTVNNEQQAYIDSSDVLFVKDGALVIQPRFRAGVKTPQGNTFDFVSGRLDTRTKFAFTYG